MQDQLSSSAQTTNAQYVMIRCVAATRVCCYFPANGSSETRVCVAYRKGELAINTIVLGTESAQGASARAKEGEEGRGRGREGKGRKRTRVVSPPLPLTNGPGRNPPSNDAQKTPKVSKRRREKRNGERGSHRHVDPRSTLSSSRDPSAI